MNRWFKVSLATLAGCAAVQACGARTGDLNEESPDFDAASGFDDTAFADAGGDFIPAGATAGSGALAGSSGRGGTTGAGGFTGGFGGTIGRGGTAGRGGFAATGGAVTGGFAGVAGVGASGGTCGADCFSQCLCSVPDPMFCAARCGLGGIGGVGGISGAGGVSGGGGTGGGVAGAGGGGVGGVAGSAGTAGAGGGGTGGVPGSVHECIVAARSGCEVCGCGSCFEQLVVCQEVRGCTNIVECAMRRRCSGADCYQANTCMNVIDDNGGPSAPSAQSANLFLGCLTSAGCPCGF